MKASGDVESVTEWMMKGAPTESVRPWAPIETSLPDPDLLGESPPVVQLLPEVVAWASREPLAFGAHACALVGLWLAAFWSLAPLVSPATGPAHFRLTCWFAVAARLWTGLWSLRLTEVLYRRYVLYQHAMKYQVDRKATLADVVVARLRLRRVRCPALFLPALGLCYLSYLLRCAAGTKRDALCGRGAPGASGRASANVAASLAALAVALPCAWFALFRYGKDPVEEESIKAKSARRCSSHGHAGG